ncbi:MAG: DUF5411 family protein [Bacilli bacterium]
MKDSFWGVFIIGAGIVTLSIIFLFQSITNTDEHNYNLLKETTEAAMEDAIDYQAYYLNKNLKINQEKFVDSFVRRFAENASLSRSYTIEIYDINESPPKVSLRVRSGVNSNVVGEDGAILEFDIENRIDAILEKTK